MIDILVIGSGPAGMSAALYGKRAGLSVTILEKNFYGIGQIAESSEVDNYIGMPKMNGYEMGQKFREHVDSLGVEFVDGEAVAFEKTAEGWQVALKDGEPLLAKSVIYAAGAKHRHLGAENEEAFIGRGVSYCATCDGAFYRGKQVAVIGGGDTALNDAVYLSDICEKVYLIHRRAEFRGAVATVNKLQELDNVELVTNAEVVKVMGEEMVTGVQLKDGKVLDVSGVFVAVGMEPMTECLQGVVDLDNQGYVIADETGVTTAEGFFVAGDVRTKMLRQVVTAVSDGANAATVASEYCRK